MGERGWTVVEIMVVVAITAVLLAIALPTMRSARDERGGMQATSGGIVIWAGISDWRQEHDGQLPPVERVTPDGLSDDVGQKSARAWPEGADGQPMRVVSDSSANAPRRVAPQDPHARYHRDADGYSGWLAVYAASGQSTFLRQIARTTDADPRSEAIG